MPQQNQAQIRFLFDDVEVTPPVNWIEIMPTTETHSVYKTIFTQFSERKLILVKDAKNIADTAYNSSGVSANIECKIQYYTSGSWSNLYNVGRLSFAPGKYKRMRDKTEVGFEPSDFIMKLLNRDELNLNLQNRTDLDGSTITAFTNETIDVTIDNQVVDQQFKFEDVSSGTIDAGDYTDKVHYILGISIVKNDQLPVIQDVSNVGIYGDTLPTTSVVKFTNDGDVYLDLYLNASITLGIYDSLTDPTVKLFYQKNFSTAVQIGSTLTLPSSNLSSTYNTSFIVSETVSSISINTDDTIRLFIEIENLTPLTTKDDITIELGSSDAIVNIIQSTSYEDTTCTGMMVWEYLLRLCQKITGVEDCLRSTVFGRTDGEVHTYVSDGDYSMYFISNVHQLRGYPIADYPLKDSLKSAFEELNKIFNLCLGVVYESGNPKIFIEKDGYQLDRTTQSMILSAGESGIDFEPSINDIFGSVKAGYAKYKEDDTGTLGTTHSPRTYTISGLDDVVTNVYDIQSNLVASGNLIELLRRKRYDPNVTEDSDYNEDVLILEVERDGSDFIPSKDNYYSVTGLDNASTQFNLSITPARNVLRHIPRLLSCVSQFADVDFLKFQTGEANTDVVTSELTGEFFQLNHGSVTGSFSNGQTVTGGTSGATAMITLVNPITPLINVILDEGSANFQTSETITTATGSATISSITEIGDEISENGDFDINLIPSNYRSELFNAAFMGKCKVLLTRTQNNQFIDGFYGYVAITDHSGTYNCFVLGKKDTNLNNRESELQIVKL